MPSNVAFRTSANDNRGMNTTNPLLAVVLYLAVLILAAVAVSPAAGDELRTLHSQPCFSIRTADVDVVVTQLGGHMAPVTFFRSTGDSQGDGIRPYYISPWQDENASDIPAPVMVPLRGDFFCLPFGGNADEVAGEKHPPHGETSSSKWSLVGSKESGDATTLTLALATIVRPGRVTKELSLVEGHNVIYSRHTIEGFAGRAPLGHHATLAMPEKEGAVRVSTSAIRFGMTCPGMFSDPKNAEYQALLPAAKWTNLSKVPAAWKGAPDADLTRQPGRFGHADLVQLANESWETTGGPAWTTATFADDGYLWFSLKDAGVLRTTVFWMENHGRHAHPWNGRNNCLGLEDVTSHFADGLAASTKENALTKAGVPTAVELTADRPTTINYIQGVAKIPPDFEIVQEVEFAPGKVTFIAPNGKRVTAPVRHEFIKSGKL